jgi:hypothetical protein
MCSSPKPKRQVKGKGGHSGSLLSNMSVEARSRFAERANLAQERRHQNMMEAKKHEISLTASIKHSYKTELNLQKSPRNFRYWLVSASLKEIFIRLFLSKSVGI